MAMFYTWGYILNPCERWCWCRMRQRACKALSTLHQCFLIWTKCLWDFRHWIQPVKPGICLSEVPEVPNWDLPGPLPQPCNHTWDPLRSMKKSFLGLTQKKLMAGQHVLHNSFLPFGHHSTLCSRSDSQRILRKSSYNSQDAFFVP